MFNSIVCLSADRTYLTRGWQFKTSCKIRQELTACVIISYIANAACVVLQLLTVSYNAALRKYSFK